MYASLTTTTTTNTTTTTTTTTAKTTTTATRLKLIDHVRHPDHNNKTTITKEDIKLRCLYHAVCISTSDWLN